MIKEDALMTEPMIEPTTDAKKNTSLWIRMWPLYIIAIAITVVFLNGWHTYLSIDTLREQRGALVAFVSDYFLVALIGFLVAYVLVTVLMVPGALWVTITGGFLFGAAIGSVATVIGATLGASLLFLAAKTSLGKPLHDRAGPFLRKLEDGFKEDSVAYMFAMRFLPVVPFPVANIAPALLGANLLPFSITTAIGVTPAVIAYSWLGAGLGAAFDAGETLDPASFFWKMAPALAFFGFLSLMTPVIKHFLGKKAPKLDAEEA